MGIFTNFFKGNDKSVVDKRRKAVMSQEEFLKDIGRRAKKAADINRKEAELENNIEKRFEVYMNQLILALENSIEQSKINPNLNNPNFRRVMFSDQGLTKLVSVETVNYHVSSWSEILNPDTLTDILVDIRNNVIPNVGLVNKELIDNLVAKKVEIERIKSHVMTLYEKNKKAISERASREKQIEAAAEKLERDLKFA